MRPSKASPAIAAGTALLLHLAANPAAAHHPTGGQTPATLWHGLLSGLGHPVIGPDHLAFIVAVGIAAALIGSGSLAIIVAFIATSTIGVLLHVASFNVPVVESLVALSVVAAGLLLVVATEQRRHVWLPLAAAAGLLHGYAFGESVIGAEQGVIGAYLAGIAVVATVIAWGVAQLTRRFAAMEVGPQRTRIAGGVVGCIGLVMLVASLVGA